MLRGPLLICLSATLAGCAGSSAVLTPVSNDQVTCEEPGPGAPLEIRYLGSGGHLIRRGSSAIMTAPFFSNPGVFRVGVGRISPDPARIDAAVEKILAEGGRLDDVQAILVGHAHYDHLMDVPRVWREYAPRAKIFGIRPACRRSRLRSRSRAISRTSTWTRSSGWCATPRFTAWWSSPTKQRPRSCVRSRRACIARLRWAGDAARERCSG